jgi:hypothetical protein
MGTFIRKADRKRKRRKGTTRNKQRALGFPFCLWPNWVRPKTLSAAESERELTVLDDHLKPI